MQPTLHIPLSRKRKDDEHVTQMHDINGLDTDDPEDIFRLRVRNNSGNMVKISILI